MRKTILHLALLAGLAGFATIVSAEPPAHSNANTKPATAPAADITRPPGVDPTVPSTANQPARATIPPGQVVPRDGSVPSPRGETVSQVAHATRDFKGLDTNRDGMIQQSELPTDHALVNAWATYDTDTNLSLSQAEFDAYVMASAGIDTDDDDDD